MTLQDKLIAKVKEYFPDIEVKTIVKPDEFGIAYGIGEVKECETQYEYVHKLISSDDVFYKASEYAAEEDLMKNLSCLRFYRTPEVLFIRAVGTKSGFDFSCTEKQYLSVARFSLGYKL